MVTHSIWGRFGFSLFANLLKSAITFGTGMLVARGLGPEEYGTMMFLLGTFVAIRQLLDGGSSTAFFTFLSQSLRSRRFVGWYFVWLGFQFVLTLLAVGLLLPASWVELIWRGEQRSLIILAFIAAYVQSVLWSAVLQMGESQRLTRAVQGVAVTVALVHFLLVVLAWWWAELSVRTVFVLVIVEWLIAAVVIVKLLRFPQVSIKVDSPRSVCAEFWRYCLPLVPYAWIGFAYEFADRWLMQTYAGSVQQAYYSVAYQFGSIAAIATASILNIFWKEIAEAHHENNQKHVALLYRRVTRGLFFVAATGAGFLAPWAEPIIRIALGEGYTDGAMTLALMFFYPLHQSMGQIGGTMAYATARVSPYVKIGTIVKVLSIVVTYFVLATPDAPLPGLGLGSFGLAGKMLVMQILSVNVLAYYLSRSLEIKFDWLFQPAAAMACMALGLLAYAITHAFFDAGSHILLAFLGAGLLYAVMILTLLWLVPDLAGLSRLDLVAIASRLRLYRS